jgi:teichoic acid transport system permease protein
VSVAEFAEREGLTRVGGRPPLRQYLAEVWRRREFIIALARFRITAENQLNRLGMAWVVLRPLINAAIYGLIFGVIMGAAGRPEDFIEFLIIGVFMFEFFSSSFTSGAKSITANSALVQSLDFPRMALPLSTIVQRFLQFVPMLGVVGILVTIGGHYPSLRWLALIPLALVFFIFNTGLALITARLTVHLQDLSQLLPFITRIIFYTSGIFFSIEQRFEDHPQVVKAAGIIPIHEFLTLGRWIFLGGADNPPHPEFWLYSSLWAIGVLAIGTVFFWRAEERYGRPD